MSSKKNYLSTTLLSLHWRKPTSDSSSEINTCTPLARECTLPSGVAENVHTIATCPLFKENTSHSIVSVLDPKHHLKVYIISFVAENSLCYQIVPELFAFSQFLSGDSKALSVLPVNLTAASYKLKHRLWVYVCKKLVDFMKKYPFNISIDKCTSSNSQNVFSILVSYFDIEIGESLVQPYKSVSLIEVNTKSLLECICNCFITDDILFEILIPDLKS